MFVADQWKDYELIDAGDGEKLERWDRQILRRPDPQAIWPMLFQKKWDNIDAYYHRSKNGGGSWEYLKKVPDKWIIKYKDLSFYIKTMGFKHTGVFPEQAVNWDWVVNKIQSSPKQLNILNLFAYTGAATVAAAFAGAAVCHVDSAKGMVEIAKENLRLSGLSERPVRFIVDDVIKFVQREGRRGRAYDGVIMDPPVYGHGPSGEVWSIEKDLYKLINLCIKILSPNPKFFIINCYTGGISPVALNNILAMSIQKNYKGSIISDEIGLPISQSNLILPCGITGRWESQ